jgi:hypothetical protein
MKMLAYCWATGEIGFADQSAPNGALPIGRGEPDKIKAYCRLAHDGTNYLVPGIPEADSGEAGLDALMAFRNLLIRLDVIEVRLSKPRGRRS